MLQAKGSTGWKFVLKLYREVGFGDLIELDEFEASIEQIFNINTFLPCVFMKLGVVIEGSIFTQLLNFQQEKLGYTIQSELDYEHYRSKEEQKKISMAALDLLSVNYNKLRQKCNDAIKK